MKRTPEEEAQRERFETFYERARSPVMRSIERRVCGCDYGGNSWTTEADARRIASLLALGPGVRLLDVGSGSGWPGLYMARTSGCGLVLVDLPMTGLRIATQRAASDDIAPRCSSVQADACELPFRESVFDAVSHSDLLCCLPQKHAVLTGCRRVLRPGGRMVFTVICVTPGLSGAARRRAVENGPDFVESDVGYCDMLTQTGWKTLEREDVTADYAASCRRQLRADDEHEEALVALLGPCAVAERRADWRSKIAALEDGLLRRELLVAAPCGADPV